MGATVAPKAARGLYANLCLTSGGTDGLRQRKSRRRAQARPQRHGAMGGPSGGQSRGPQAAAARDLPAGTKSRDGIQWRWEHQVLQRLQLKDGAPDEPDTGDWDAICATPRIDDFFAALFKEVAGFNLPAPVIESEEEDSVRHVRVGWCGSKTLGAEVTVISCTETSAFPVYCDWETFGLPGMKVRWQYALEKAGQLGHVAYRHQKLECTFESSADQQRFAEIWRRHIAKTPVFEPAENEA